VRSSTRIVNRYGAAKEPRRVAGRASDPSQVAIRAIPRTARPADSPKIVANLRAWQDAGPPITGDGLSSKSARDIMRTSGRRPPQSNSGNGPCRRWRYAKLAQSRADVAPPRRSRATAPVRLARHTSCVASSRSSHPVGKSRRLRGPFKPTPCSSSPRRSGACYRPSRA